MKFKNEIWNTLDGVLDNIWLMLEQGAVDMDDPFHWPVLGTNIEDGCSLRTVILRKVNASERTLVCYTDTRSAKVKEITNCPHTSWLFYDPKNKIQVRTSGYARLHAHDPYADRLWADISTTSRLNYCTAQPPGTHQEAAVRTAIWRDHACRRYGVWASLVPYKRSPLPPGPAYAG